MNTGNTAKLTPTGNDVYVADLNLGEWKVWRSGQNRATGERGPIYVATIREITEDRAYAITYPVPKPFPGSTGRRTYQHAGDLDSAIARVRKFARWSGIEATV